MEPCLSKGICISSSGKRHLQKSTTTVFKRKSLGLSPHSLSPSQSSSSVSFKAINQQKVLFCNPSVHTPTSILGPELGLPQVDSLSLFPVQCLRKLLHYPSRQKTRPCLITPIYKTKHTDGSIASKPIKPSDH